MQQQHPRQPGSAYTVLHDLKDRPSQHYPLLDPSQTIALERLLSHLDPHGAGCVIGLFGPPQTDKTAVLSTLVGAGTGRRVRTPEHRKVVGVLLDAGDAGSGNSRAWQRLLFEALELLGSNAMPGDRKQLNDLRNELAHLVRLSASGDNDDALAVAAFTHHFRTAFPRLVQNVFALSNAVMVIGVDHLDQAEPQEAAEWLEAASYFLNTTSCAMVFGADETTLLARLEQLAPGKRGQEVLRQWMTARVDIGVETVPPSPARPAALVASAPPIGNADVPSACLQIMSDALQPERYLLPAAVENWRAGMRAVAIRAEEGLPVSVSAPAMAKLVALRMLSPQLFDAARYDARMLVALERQARAGARPGMSDDWLSAVYANPRLKTLLVNAPDLSTMELRDLATALRLAHTGQAVGAVATFRPSDTAAVGVSRSPDGLQTLGQADTTVSVQSSPAALHGVKLPVLPAPALAAGLAAGAVIATDRVAKLLASAVLRPGEMPAAGVLGFGIPQPADLANTVILDSLAVGAELFSLALAILILLFWGSGRPRAVHAVSLGLISGGLVSNLVDRLAYGNLLNFIQVPGLPVFNLAHAALLVGAVLLAISILSHAFSRAQVRANA